MHDVRTVYVDGFRQTAATSTTKTDQKCTKQATHHFINYPNQSLAGLKAPVGRNPESLVRRHPRLSRTAPALRRKATVNLGSKLTDTRTHNYFPSKHHTIFQKAKTSRKITSLNFRCTSIQPSPIFSLLYFDRMFPYKCYR